MALYQRGRVWYLDYYANGERVQESAKTTNRRDAEKLHSLRMSEVLRHVHVRDLRVSLDELSERYIEYAQTRKRSWKRDVQMLGNLKAFFGNPLLRDITPLRVEKFQEARVREVAPATVNRELALLKHMYFMAERWQLHVGNPVRLVRFLAENNLRFHTLSPEVERRLLAASPPYLRDMIQFAINTGLRTNEIFNLTWEEVDVEERLINLVTKKNQKVLTLPLNATALALLSGRQRHGVYVFSNPMTGDRFKDVKGALAAAVKRAGLRKVTWHMFRHTFASRLTRSGVDIVTVKDLLGHSNINVTMRYAHTNEVAKRSAVEKLNTSDSVVTVGSRSTK